VSNEHRARQPWWPPGSGTVRRRPGPLAPSVWLLRCLLLAAGCWLLCCSAASCALVLGTCVLWGFASENSPSTEPAKPCLAHASLLHFPDLTADNCPRDRSDPIDDLHGLQRWALSAGTPEPKGPHRSSQGSKVCTSRELLHSAALAESAAQPALPALVLDNSTEPNLHAALCPSGLSCTTFSSALLHHPWLLVLNSWN
jgi:hypothetical protein